MMASLPIEDITELVLPALDIKFNYLQVNHEELKLRLSESELSNCEQEWHIHMIEKLGEIKEEKEAQKVNE